MSTIEIFCISALITMCYLLMGTLSVLFLKDWLKGRAFLWYVAIMFFWPIASIIAVVSLPWVFLEEIYREAKKPPKRIYIDPAILYVARQLIAAKELNKKQQQKQ